MVSLYVDSGLHRNDECLFDCWGKKNPDSPGNLAILAQTVCFS